MRKGMNHGDAKARRRRNGCSPYLSELRGEALPALPLASIVFKPDGTGHGLYTEVVDLTSLGRLKVERATTITFDNRRQVWRVKDRTGFPLFTSPSRETCLEWEKQYFMGKEE